MVMEIAGVRYNGYDSMECYWAFGGVLDIYGCLLTGGVWMEGGIVMRDMKTWRRYFESSYRRYVLR